MATRRRKLPRKRKGRQATAVRGAAVEPVNAARPSKGGLAQGGLTQGGLATSVRGSAAAASKTSKGRGRVRYVPTGDAAAGRFLSPEQQHLMKKRREAEQREAKDRRTALAIILALVLLAAGAVAGLVWLWRSSAF